MKIQMRSRVIAKIQLLEHRQFERFEMKKYQNMHIFRIEIKFSLKIKENFWCSSTQFFGRDFFQYA